MNLNYIQKIWKKCWKKDCEIKEFHGHTFPNGSSISTNNEKKLKEIISQNPHILEEGIYGTTSNEVKSIGIHGEVRVEEESK